MILWLVILIQVLLRVHHLKPFQRIGVAQSVVLQKQVLFLIELLNWRLLDQSCCWNCWWSCCWAPAQAGQHHSAAHLLADDAALAQQSYVLTVWGCKKWSPVTCKNLLVKSDPSPMKSGFISRMWLSLVVMRVWRPGSRRWPLLHQILKAISNLPPEVRKPSTAFKKFKRLKTAIEDRRPLTKKRLMLVWFMTTSSQGFTARIWPSWSIVTLVSDSGPARSTRRSIIIKGSSASCDIDDCKKSCLCGLLFEQVSAKAPKVWHLPCHLFFMRRMIMIAVR